jgi:hypothetical protein
MSKESLLILLGAIVTAVALIDGPPSGWKKIIFLLVGVVVVITAYLLRRERLFAPGMSSEGQHTDVFVQNGMSGVRDH